MVTGRSNFPAPAHAGARCIGTPPRADSSLSDMGQVGCTGGGGKSPLRAGVGRRGSPLQEQTASWLDAAKQPPKPPGTRQTSANGNHSCAAALPGASGLLAVIWRLRGRRAGGRREGAGSPPRHRSLPSPKSRAEQPGRGVTGARPPPPHRPCLGCAGCRSRGAPLRALAAG